MNVDEDIEKIVRFQSEFIRLVEEVDLDPFIAIELVAQCAAHLIYENAADYQQERYAELVGLYTKSHLLQLEH